MCTLFNAVDSQRWIENKIKEGKPLTGYKVVHEHAGILGSFFNHYIWHVGEMHTSSREGRELTEEEHNCNCIYEGFHFFEDISDVILFCSQYYDCKAWEFEIQPEDLVAHGIGQYERIFVAHKAKPIKKVC